MAAPKLREQTYAVEAIDEVKPHPANSRRGDLEAIEGSMAANGIFGAVYAQVRRDGTKGPVIAGNHRVRAAKNAGATHIPVIRIVCTDIEAERMARADNRTHDLGEGDDPELLLASLQRIADEGDGSLEGTGYTDLDLAALEAEVAALDDDEADGGGASEDDDAKPDEGDETWHVPEEPITELGDVWILGEHRVMCGDTMRLENRRELFGRETVSLVLTDPPYAIYGSSTGIGADIADDKMVRPFFDALSRMIAKTVKVFGHVYVCCDWRTYAIIFESNKAAKLSPKNCIVWDKGGGLGSSYANCHEFISFFAKLPPPTAMKSSTQRGQRTVLAPNVMKYNRVVRDEREHNAAKPVGMFEWLIGNSSDVGDLVADFFLGSGTTVIAAEKTGRRCYGFELEPKYCDVIVARWERLTGKKATRVAAKDRAPTSRALPTESEVLEQIRETGHIAKPTT